MTDLAEHPSMTTAEISEAAQALVNSYTPDPVPPCRVCGGKLSIQAIGGGRPTVYACSGSYEDENGAIRRSEGRSPADEHYSNSRWEQYRHGNRLVLNILRELLKDRGIPMPEVERH